MGKLEHNSAQDSTDPSYANTANLASDSIVYNPK